MTGLKLLGRVALPILQNLNKSSTTQQLYQKAAAHIAPKQVLGGFTGMGGPNRSIMTFVKAQDHHAKDSDRLVGMHGTSKAAAKSILENQHYDLGRSGSTHGSTLLGGGMYLADPVQSHIAQKYAGKNGVVISVYEVTDETTPGALKRAEVLDADVRKGEEGPFFGIHEVNVLDTNGENHWMHLITRDGLEDPNVKYVGVIEKESPSPVETDSENVTTHSPNQGPLSGHSTEEND